MFSSSPFKAQGLSAPPHILVFKREISYHPHPVRGERVVVSGVSIPLFTNWPKISLSTVPLTSKRNISKKVITTVAFFLFNYWYWYINNLLQQNWQNNQPLLYLFFFYLILSLNNNDNRHLSISKMYLFVNHMYILTSHVFGHDSQKSSIFMSPTSVWRVTDCKHRNKPCAHQVWQKYRDKFAFMGKSGKNMENSGTPDFPYINTDGKHFEFCFIHYNISHYYLKIQWDTNYPA